MAYVNHHRVPEQWRGGRAAEGGSLTTDGKVLQSYGTTIGVTVGAGYKVAFDCHHSTTTARHANGAKVQADLVTRCPHVKGVAAHVIPDAARRQIVFKALLASLGEPAYGALVAIIDDPIARLQHAHIV